MTVNPDGPIPIPLGSEGDGEDPRLGQRVGRYLLRRLLGRGGTGMVYEATHCDWGQRVAIKILPALGRGDALAQALHEARAVNRVPHPGLARINDSGLLPDGAAYLVMDLLEGESLFDHLRARGGVLPVHTGLVLLRQAASVLAAAHACQVLHLDLKPENLFVCYDPEVPGGLRTKLLDFGLAQVHSVRAAWLRYRRAGTPLYMAPEQWQGQALSAQTDVYALGVILFQCLVGRPPFAGTAAALRQAHSRTAPPLSVLRTALPAGAGEGELAEALEILVGRMLAKDPRERPEAAQVAAGLARCATLAADLAAQTPARAADAPAALHGHDLGLDNLAAAPTLIEDDEGHFGASESGDTSDTGDGMELKGSAAERCDNAPAGRSTAPGSASAARLARSVLTSVVAGRAARVQSSPVCASLPPWPALRPPA